MTVMSRNFKKKDFDDPVKAATAVKREALGLGADVVGIGNIDRWKNAPIQMDPKQIMPECKSIIAMAYRMNRGSLRGIEEGTYFGNYSSMGYAAITFLFWPMIVVPLSKFIEDRGFEAVPYGHLNPWGAPLKKGVRPNFSRPVAPGRARPDVIIHLRIAAYLCGLGEIGFSKMLLTPQFGPRNRIGIVLTDVELAPDPIYDGPKLCNRCMACVKSCPGQVYDPKKTVKVKLAGHNVEWMDLDCDKCSNTFRGAVLTTNKVKKDKQYLPGVNSRPGEWTPFYKVPPYVYNYGQAVCGGRGCIRGCMVNLEEHSRLQNKFRQKFRRRPAWKVDWNKKAD